ncbi:MAG: hypothetical protein P1V35_11175 [Planctomycetota bacterium]|nr:hypothetical protein [Planctomycetota bacterium]
MIYLGTLFATVIAELLVAALLFKGRPPKDLWTVILCVNLCTHPVASFLLNGPWHGLGFWPIEWLVLLAEFAMYLWVTHLKTSRAAYLSLATNGCTVALSFLLP